MNLILQIFLEVVINELLLSLLKTYNELSQ